MRYSLRNKEKISKALGKSALDNVIVSLNDWFSCNMPLDTMHSDKEPYPMLLIDSNNKDAAMIVFYVLNVTFDVYNLALKEIVK